MLKFVLIPHQLANWQLKLVDFMESGCRPEAVETGEAAEKDLRVLLVFPLRKR